MGINSFIHKCYAKTDGVWEEAEKRCKTYEYREELEKEKTSKEKTRKWGR